MTLNKLEIYYLDFLRRALNCTEIWLLLTYLFESTHVINTYWTFCFAYPFQANSISVYTCKYFWLRTFPPLGGAQLDLSRILAARGHQLLPIMKIFAEKVIILYKNKVAADLQRLSQQLIHFDICMKIIEEI